MYVGYFVPATGELTKAGLGTRKVIAEIVFESFRNGSQEEFEKI